MELDHLPVRDVRDALRAERADLLALLADLSQDEWVAPTDAGHWRVKDVVLHVLDDDFGWLSRDRDADSTGLLAMSGDYREFVRSLDAKNERWVQGAAGLSRRLVTDLLRWSGREVDAHFAAMRLDAPSHVIWASGQAVPRWFDLCRELTERWVHHQHVRDAVDRPGRHDRFLTDVLGTFVWAFPHQYRARAADGTTVELRFGDAGTWHLRRHVDRWVFEDGATPTPDATFAVAPADAWRQLTGLPVGDGAVRTDGPDELVRPLLAVRGIIA